MIRVEEGVQKGVCRHCFHYDQRRLMKKGLLVNFY